MLTLVVGSARVSWGEAIWATKDGYNNVTMNATGVTQGSCGVVVTYWDYASGTKGPTAVASGALPLFKNNAWGGTFGSWAARAGDPVKVKFELDGPGGVVLATAYYTWDGAVWVQTDASYTQAVQRATYSGGGGSCQVWATRTGDVGTIFVGHVTVPAGVTSCVIGYGYVANGAQSVAFVYQSPPGDPPWSKGFNLAGLGDGTAEYVEVGYPDPTSGEMVWIFQGNVLFPSKETDTSVVPGPTSPTTSTYGPGTTTTTSPVVKGTGTGTGTGGGGGGGGTGGLGGMGTATNPVVTTQSGVAPGSGDGGAGVVTSRQSWLAVKLAAAGLDWSSITPNGQDDYTVHWNVPLLGSGQGFDYTFHWIPEGGSAIDGARILIRSVLLGFCVLSVSVMVLQQLAGGA